MRFGALCRFVVVVLLGLLPFSNARAQFIDSFAVEIGSGDSVDMARIAVQRDWRVRWFQRGNWHLGGYWDLALGYWDRGRVAPGQHDNLFDFSLTPVFRIQPNGLVGPYIEAAIGFHFLSHTSIGDRRMSTAFQFGDHIGIGYRFGAKSHYELGYRFQHLSNAGIKHPNPGINFHQIRLQYHF
jgi:lipid A 3-O-deacylase